MKYADSVREFIPTHIQNATSLLTPRQVFSAWLHRQHTLAEEGVDFNEDGVLAVDVHTEYNKVEQELFDEGRIHKLQIAYGTVSITVFVPDGATMSLDSKKVNLL